MPRCFECGSEAEYVGLGKVENCSNPECRYYGLPDDVDQKKMLAVDPASGGAASLNAGRLSGPGVKPIPEMKKAQNCAACWAFNGTSCRKYARPELPRHALQLVCDNFEWRPGS